MAATSRRAFLESVGCGMLVAGLGPTLAQEMGLASAAERDGAPLNFGAYERLVDLMQCTPPSKLQPLLVSKLQAGEANVQQLMAAAALANAEAFGGEDYVGFHTAMAILPALELSGRLPSERQALPVLKVIYRNSQQIQDLGGESKKSLRRMHAVEDATVESAGLAIRDACRSGDVARGEQIFAHLAAAPLEEQFEALQPTMQDEINVHRFVFAFRTRGLAELLGKEYAHTILRQCVHFSCTHESDRIKRNSSEPAIRQQLPKLIDAYRLSAPRLGTRDPGDAAVEELAEVLYQGPPERSAEAAAAALADGISPEVVGEAISLAANLLVLRQVPVQWRAHGDSQGVHASDGTNAWRNMARVLPPALAASGLILAANHVAVYSPYEYASYPTADHRALVSTRDAGSLLDEAEDAIRQNDQIRAAAAIAIYGEQGFSPDAVFERMLKYTVSEDGRLHGEKYFQTVQEEFRTTRPAFRWRQLIGLARVTASAYGYDRQDQHNGRAPGYEEACRLLGVPA